MAGTGRHQQRRDQRLLRIAMFRCHVSILVFLVGEAVCLSSHLQVHPRIGYPQVLEIPRVCLLFTSVYQYSWTIFEAYRGTSLVWTKMCCMHVVFTLQSQCGACYRWGPATRCHGSGRKHCEPRFSAFGRDPSAENSFSVELRRVVKRASSYQEKPLRRGTLAWS